MARTKEFDPEEALEAAMELFWRRGYEATSMRSLLEGMGVGRGSFYDTYGDKRALFLAALDRFEKNRTTWALEVLETSLSPVAGIEEVFGRTLESLVGYEPRRGCLLANSAVELAPHDPEVAAHISGYVRRLEGAFEDALERARKMGEIPKGSKPTALARFLVTSLHGLRVMARAGAERETLEDAVGLTLKVVKPDG
jgi:TetR/AcrR family transcriptional regulator, transcriptional repressor for nem operon